eukprot:NODE_88_length_21932_cov_0.317867.p12 type:complete len:160 gc:universal NODE_88_length_21932_cov_0.317867:12757-12278(-)
MTKLYFPELKDYAIGIVDSKLSSEYYKIYINSTQFAIISNLDFRNVVKRNKQILEVGDAIYGQITETVPDPMISCRESVGLLRSGMVVKVNCNYCTRFNEYKSLLAKYFNFECLVGRNGMIFINHEDPAILVVLYNIIKRGEYLDIDEYSALLKQVIKK